MLFSHHKPNLDQNSILMGKTYPDSRVHKGGSEKSFKLVGVHLVDPMN
jgi:hypothetical protein